MPAVRDNSSLRLTVVVPVYNERLTLPEILERVQAVTIPKEIIIVDDCSTDGTRDFLRSLEGELAEARRLGTADEKNEIRVFYQEPNQGKGAALRRGFAEATGDIVLVQSRKGEAHQAIAQPTLVVQSDAVAAEAYDSLVVCLMTASATRGGVCRIEILA